MTKNSTITKTTNRIIKLLSVFVISFLCIVGAYAQSYIDVVYLKNGSIIKGIIIEQIPNVSLKIETPDGSTIICSVDDVTKMTKEVSQRQINTDQDTYNKTTQGSNSRVTNFTKRYEGSIEAMGGIKVDPLLGTGKIQLSTVHRYKFSPYFYVGLGVGFQYDFTTEVFSMPLFVSLKTNFLRSKISPFFSVDCGYAIGFKTISAGRQEMGTGGFLVNPMIGVTFKTQENTSVNLGIGYNLQSVVCLAPGTSSLYKAMGGSLSLKLGISF